ncbi:MAG: ubiquinone biosynthesis regulatory protein kinase UbiB [Lysobacterales bacterium]
MRAFLRIWRIGRVLVRYRLDEVTPAARLFRPLTWLRALSGDAVGAAGMARGERLRRALEELGPIFVKFGQILSTRRDLLPQDVADELEKLQDRVAPFPGAEARVLIEAELGASIATHYASFDEKPLASASIAQVHAATLHDGREVVIKVLRPGIRERVNGDLALLKAIAAIAEKRLAHADRIRPTDVVTEIERTLTLELDLMREAANGSLLRRNWTGSKEMYVPEMLWPLTRTRMITMERVYGIALNDVEGLRAAGINFEKLAERAVRLFYTQVFRDNFFHADLHPGNVLIAREHADDPLFIALDFGIMGTLPPADQRYLAENFMAMFTQDYRRIAELHVEAGWMPNTVRIDDLEGAVRGVCEPYFTRPLSEISLGEVLMKLFAVAQQYQLTLQPQLILLQKTLLNIEGLARTLFPKLDLWAVAKPVLAQIMADKYGFNAALKEIRVRLPGLVQNAPEIPRLLHEYLKQSVSGQHQLRMRSPDIEKLIAVTRQGQRQTVLAILGSGLMIVAGLLFAFDAGGPKVLGVPAAAGIAGLGALWAFMAAWPRR